MHLTIKTPLLDHQLKAVNKIGRLKIGALFMEMGLGKTLTMIAIIASKLHIKRVFWFCPVSLKETVKQLILKHCVADGGVVFQDSSKPNTIRDAFWHIVGIESMSSSSKLIVAMHDMIDKDACCVVDESSYIKGDSARTKWITRVAQKASWRYILTGTPLTQGVVDLYYQFRFLEERILGYSSFNRFAANHLEYSKKFPGLIVRSHNVPWLAAKIAPYVYQVSKVDANVNLPDKLYSARYYAMTCEQKDIYERAKYEILSEVLEDPCSYTIFKLFTALQQITSGYWKRRDSDTRQVELIQFEHRRITTLIDTLQAIPSDDKVIIWAKYHHDISAIVKALGNDCAQFHGLISLRHREEQLKAFRSHKRYLVATTSCGGHGLTLTECCYNVFFNNEFKFANRIQAEDRTHRIGQTRRVTYIDIMCSDSIDTRIAESLQRKANVLEDFKIHVDKVKGNCSTKDAIKVLAHLI